MYRKLHKLICGAVSFATFCAGTLRAENNPASPATQKLFFGNGDLIVGNLESISPGKSVIWKRSDVALPIEFSGTNLAEIRFAPRASATFNQTNYCRVELRNGDLLEGNLLQLDSDKITLDTAFAGKLIFPRKVVQRIEPLPPEQKPIFTGPTGLAGWTMGKVTAAAAGEVGEWKYTNGAFYATQSSSIARDVKLPDVARIEFDVAWKGMLQAAIALYTGYMQPINLANKENEPDFGGFYSLQINSFMATLMPVKKNEPLKYLAQTPVPQFGQNNSAHIEVRANKKKASIALFVDDILVKEWIDTDGFAGTGTALRLVHQGGQGSIKLSNLRIAEWDGKMETKPTNNFVGNQDLATLANGDKMVGTVETMRDGKMIFATSGAKLDVPLARISQIYFSGEGAEKATRLGANVRAFLPNNGRVTFQVEQWTNSSATGTSANFGRATFATSAFERVQLNLVSTNQLAEIPGE